MASEFFHVSKNGNLKINIAVFVFLAPILLIASAVAYFCYAIGVLLLAFVLFLSLCFNVWILTKHVEMYELSKKVEMFILFVFSFLCTLFFYEYSFSFILLSFCYMLVSFNVIFDDRGMVDLAFGKWRG